MATSFKNKILVVDDDKFNRETLSNMLQEVNRMSASQCTVNEKIVKAEMAKFKPDVVVMNIGNNHKEGLDWIQKIRKINPLIKIIIHSVQCDMPTIMRLFEVGAIAFLDKNTDFTEYLKCINSVIKLGYFDNEYFNATIRENILNTVQLKILNEGGILLTKEEIEMIICITNDNSFKVMETVLFLNIKTLQRHKRLLLKKINCKGTGGITKFAIRNKIITV